MAERPSVVLTKHMRGRETGGRGRRYLTTVLTIVHRTAYGGEGSKEKQRSKDKLVQEPDAGPSHYRMLSQAAETLDPFDGRTSLKDAKILPPPITINGP
ncbi:hypothetical protein K0M31_017878 [Melipona bicolor]|uniref:Uncharacterized protein n=1 Tax=Melipona bicolor TaxID=60889 RepID=A0AA40G5P5_9HYME|nr:hypothetical protein K0M31_017878 [Melipona bicolor]